MVGWSCFIEAERVSVGVLLRALVAVLGAASAHTATIWNPSAVLNAPACGPPARGWGVPHSLSAHCLQLVFMVSCAALLHMAPSWEVGLRALWRGTLVWSALSEASAVTSLWASGNRGSTEEREKVRLYYPDSLFISWELLMGFSVTRFYQPFFLVAPTYWDKHQGPLMQRNNVEVEAPF